jgi:hypothetical protein
VDASSSYKPLQIKSEGISFEVSKVKNLHFSKSVIQVTRNAWQGLD